MLVQWRGKVSQSRMTRALNSQRYLVFHLFFLLIIFNHFWTKPNSHLAASTTPTVLRKTITFFFFCNSLHSLPESENAIPKGNYSLGWWRADGGVGSDKFGSDIRPAGWIQAEAAHVWGLAAAEGLTLDLKSSAMLLLVWILWRCDWSSITSHCGGEEWSWLFTADSAELIVSKIKYIKHN